MKKILKWSVGIIAVFLICVLSVGALFITSTYSVSESFSYCEDNTHVEAEEFYVSEISQLEGYRFYVACGQDETSGQEMFIFRKKLLLGIFDIDRYEFIHHVKGSPNQPVSSLEFEAKGTYAKEETGVVLFFSSNKQNISSYQISYQENARYCEVTGYVATEMPFATAMVGVGNSEYSNKIYLGAIFYNEDNDVIATKGNVEHLLLEEQ